MVPPHPVPPLCVLLDNLRVVLPVEPPRTGFSRASALRLEDENTWLSRSARHGQPSALLLSASSITFRSGELEWQIVDKNALSLVGSSVAAVGTEQSRTE